MNKYYKLNVSLTVKGPFLTSGGGDAEKGLNSVFTRGANGDLILKGSHVKGKLREAMREIYPESEKDKEWFGDETGNNDNENKEYLPKRSKLVFTDFYLENSNSLKPGNRYTRVSIYVKTGTSKENFLQSMEMLFQAGSTSVWSGQIGFFGEDDNKAKEVMNKLVPGLKWITALGSIKGSGYGRLEKVSASLETCTMPSAPPSLKRVDHTVGLVLEFLDDLHIGGVVKGSNYRETQTIIPGGVIKGSLARFLNELCGEQDLTKPIDSHNEAVAKEFGILAENFINLHISHAFPAPPLAGCRPVVRPFSCVEVGDIKKEYWDVALCEDVQLYHKQLAPAFQIDWKNSDALKADFGWADCEIIHKTRTAIKPETRTAEENKLYTFQYVTPFSADHASNAQTNSRPKIRWMAKIRFPALESEKTETMIRQFVEAVHAGWQFMGKRSSRFGFQFVEKTAHPKLGNHENGLIREKQSIITLQTDALMFDASQLVKGNKQRDDDFLKKVYEAYWEQVLDGSGSLKRFFTRQKMVGGYLAKRFRTGADYYPDVLTEAGSVFVLEISDEIKAKEKLELFVKQGLPLPDDVLLTIKQRGKELWQTCPFVPENGYGEIAVNLPWHWDKSLKSMHKEMENVKS